MLASVNHQSIGLNRLARNFDLWGLLGNGGLDVTPIANTLGPIVDRHVNAWHKHVNHISYHPPNYQRIHIRGHGT